MKAIYQEKIAALDGELAAIRDKCLKAHREPNEGEMTRANAILAEIDRMEAAGNVTDKIEARPYFAESTGVLAGRNFSPMGGVTTTPWRPGGPLFAKTGETGGFDSMGAFVSSILEKGPHDSQLRRFRAEGQKSGVPSEGGYLVPGDMAKDFLALVVETSPILQRARIYPMTTDTIKIPAVDDSDHSADRGGLVAVWKGEGVALSVDTVRTRQIELQAKKLTILCKGTREFMRDGLNAERFIRDTMVKEAAWTMDGAFIRGDGVGKPLGMLNAPSLKVSTKEAGQVADSIVWENIMEMYEGLNPTVLRPVWFASPSAKRQLLQLQIALGVGGMYFWPTLRDATLKGLELIGGPVYFTEHCEVIGDQGDILLAAPENYLIGLRQEVEIDVSPHVGFLTDEVYFRLTMRVDAQPLSSATLTLRDGTTIVSDFVTLEAR